VIVSTEDSKIAEIAANFGAEVPFVRPVGLSQDSASSIDVLLHSVEWLETDGYDFDILVLLHTTAPLREPEDIDNCIELLAEKDCENVFSVTEAQRNPYFNMVEESNGRVIPVKRGDFGTRQKAPKVYDLNSSIYVWWKEVLKKKKSLYLKGSKIYVMPKERSVDIDDETDFKLAKMLMEEKQACVS
jgi:CMP-N-acetylneuraminic acid synthetase